MASSEANWSGSTMLSKKGEYAFSTTSVNCIKKNKKKKRIISRSAAKPNRTVKVNQSDLHHFFFIRPTCMSIMAEQWSLWTAHADAQTDPILYCQHFICCWFSCVRIGLLLLSSYDVHCSRNIFVSIHLRDSFMILRIADRLHAESVRYRQEVSDRTRDHWPSRTPQHLSILRSFLSSGQLCCYRTP